MENYFKIDCGVSCDNEVLRNGGTAVMWQDDRQIAVIEGCEKDKDENTLDDLIKGLQKLRVEYGNLRVVTDYDCSYRIDPLLIEYFKPIKDAKGKVCGFCVYA